MASTSALASAGDTANLVGSSAVPGPTPAPDAEKPLANVIPFTSPEVQKQPVQDASQQSADQLSNLLAPASLQRQLYSDYNPTPTQKSLQTLADNPLSIPDDENKRLIGQVANSAVPLASPPAPQEPIAPATPGAFLAPELQAAAPKPAEQPFQAPELQTFQSPELASQEARDMGPEQVYRNEISRWDNLIKPYEDDPEKIANAYKDHGIEDHDLATSLVLYAQHKYDAKEMGMDDWQKTVEDATNAGKWLGSAIKTALDTVKYPLQIPSQVFGTIGNAVNIAAPFDEAPVTGPAEVGNSSIEPMKPPAGSEALVGQPGTKTAAIQPNTPLASPDIVTGGAGSGGGTTPQERQEIEDLRRQGAARALVAGVQEGTANNLDFAINAASHLIGLTSTAPNALLKVFGGPQIGYIDPKVQTWLATTHGLPIASSKSWMDMDPNEVATNLMIQRMQGGASAQRGQGYVGEGAQKFLDTWAGKTVDTPEGLAAKGYPVPLKAIQDTAATANLVEGAVEFGLLGRLADAAGVSSVLNTASQKTLGAGADVAQGIADWKPPAIVVNQAARLGNWGGKALDKAIGFAAGHYFGTEFNLPYGEIFGSMLHVPIASGPLGLLAKGAGWIPKATSWLADQGADALRLAASDPENLLATRSAVKQLFSLGAKRAVEGAASTAPLTLGDSNPEDVGSMLGLGAGMGLAAHIIPDLADIAKSRAIDSAFITDTNWGQSRKPAKPPTPYGTDKNLDAAHAAAMESSDPVTNKPLFSNAQKHLMNDLRSGFNGVAEAYVLNPKAYDAEVQRMNGLGYTNDPAVNSRGIAIDPNPGENQARVLIRSTNFKDAVYHELAHPIVNRMGPEDLQTAFQAYARTNDPNEFTKNYTRLAKGGGQSVNYDSLPSDAGIAKGTEQYVPGFQGMTKEDMQREMATEAVSGLLKGGSVRDLTRDPTMLHNMQQTFWRALDNLGFDPDMTRSASPLGLKQSMPAAMVLEPLVRDTLRRNLGANAGMPTDLSKPVPGKVATGKPSTGSVTPSAPSVGGASVDEGIISGLVRKGFTRQQALDFWAKSQAQSAQSAAPGSGPTSPKAVLPSQASVTPQSQTPPQGGAPAQPPVSTGPAPNAPAQPPASPLVPPQEQTGETTEQSAPLQKVLREDAKLDPGTAQEIAQNRPPRTERGSTGTRGARGAGAGRPVGRDMGGKAGAFGYIGDGTPDTNSLLGIGAYPHVRSPGSMIEGYSAGLTEEAGRMRGLVHGQEFIANGHLYRWDDTAPKYQTLKNGQHIVIPDEYIDVYSPSRAPDRGVSAAEIARQTKIAQGRPGFSGVGSEKGENEGGTGRTTGRETPAQQGAPPITERETPASPVAAPEAKPEAKSPIGHEAISLAESDARESIDQGKMSDEAYTAAIQKNVLQTIGEQHAASLDPNDTRVQLRPGGYIGGTHFVDGDAYHEFLLRGQSPQVMDVLRQVQDAIATKRDVFATYKSAPQEAAGTPTVHERSVAQAKSSAADRAKGLADIQQAGKELAPSWVGISPGKGGEPNTVLVGGSSSDKIASNASQLIHGLGPKSPYSTFSPVAMEDLKGALHNQNNGWKMDGSAKLTPTPGHEADIPKESPGFVPYHMSKAKGDFWNLAAGQGSGAKMSENAMRAPESAAAFEMARANQGTAEGGYTNPLARSLDMAHPLEPVLDSEGKPKIGKNGKPVTKTWTQSKLHSPWETLRVDNIAGIHDSGGSPFEKIHPGQPEVSAAIEERGTPKSFQSKAGFLPAKTEVEEESASEPGKTSHVPLAALHHEDDKIKQLQERIEKLEKASHIRTTSNYSEKPLPGETLRFAEPKIREQTKKNGAYIRAGDFERKFHIRLSKDPSKMLHIHAILLGPKWVGLKIS